MDSERRMKVDEFLRAALELIKARTDQDLAGWARAFGQRLVDQLQLSQAHIQQLQDCIQCLQNANSAGTQFLREAAEAASTLPLDSPGRQRIFEAGMSHGPQLLGQIAAAQAALLSRDPEERNRIAHETIDTYLGQAQAGLGFTITDEDLKVN